MTAILLIGSYVFGAIPFGLILGKLCCGVDLREVGSGNIGASNAWRVLGWKVGIPVFLLDMAKGFVPVCIARLHVKGGFLPTSGLASPIATFEALPHADWIIVACGIAAILGHNFSPFLRFKGGKGVATSLGVCIAMSFKAAIAGVSVWAFLLILTRYISVGSLIGTPIGALSIWLDNGRALPYAIFGALATAFVVIKHIPNMKRLAVGTESKIAPLQDSLNRARRRRGPENPA